MFEELEQEISNIKTRRFHSIEHFDSRRSEYQVPMQLPQSYLEFCAKFGTAKLYRIRDYYQVGVLCPPQELTLQNGEKVLNVGHFQSHLAYFKVSLLSVETEPPVFEATGMNLVKVADDFEHWLLKRCAQARKTYTSKEWKRILKGPPPFSEEEEAKVLARRRYAWSLVGFDDEGNARIAIRNNSELTLPYLTIGVRAKDNTMQGKAWLNVSKIQPGEERLVTHPLYKEQIARENIELYDLDDPTPEEREIFWEFRED